MKKKYLSALLSGMLLPGAGQIANKQYIKGGIFIFLTVAFFVGFVCILIGGYVLVFLEMVNEGIGESNTFDRLFFGLKRGGWPLVISFLGVVAVWICATVDAYFFGSDTDEV